MSKILCGCDQQKLKCNKRLLASSLHSMHCIWKIVCDMTTLSSTYHSFIAVLQCGFDVVMVIKPSREVFVELNIEGWARATEELVWCNGESDAPKNLVVTNVVPMEAVTEKTQEMDLRDGKPSSVNSLAPGRSGSNFKSRIFKLIIQNNTFPWKWWNCS